MECRPISLFLPSLSFGGVERSMLNLATGLMARGERVDVVAAQAAGELAGQVPSGARVIDLNSHRVVAGLRGLARYLRRERPRALISALDHANVVALWARRLAAPETRVVVTVHCLPSAEARAARHMRGRLSPWFVRGFYGWADSVVAVSAALADDLARTCGVARKRIHVVSAPVLTPALFALAREPVTHAAFSSGEAVILGAGRLAAQKRWEVLIRALPQIRRGACARLAILGEGPERARLQALAAELGVADAVDLPGYTPNPYAWMARAAVLALPSEYEALGAVLIEALALGARVVASDTPGAREVLGGGKYGRLVPVGNAEALAAAVVESMAQPRPAMPAEMLEAYTVEAVTEAYLRMIAPERMRAAGAAG